jgi:hypothetical protein
VDTLGVDIGGVLIKRVDTRLDTSFFGDNYLATPAVADAFDALRSLNVQRFGDRIFLVSKCGIQVQARTKEWLEHHRFYDRTGMLRSHVHFCRKRSEKSGICQELGITHFVDDRLEVLSYLDSVPHRYLFGADPDEVRQFAAYLPRVRQVLSWAELLPLLVEDRIEEAQELALDEPVAEAAVGEVEAVRRPR